MRGSTPDRRRRLAGAIYGRPGAGTDLLYGIGGTPEGVLAAAARKRLGGEIQGRLYPRDEADAGRRSKRATTSTRS